MQWTYAIVEDEAPSAARLRRMIQGLRPEATCIGSPENGSAALELLRINRPSVVFLDIDFPPAGAFELLRQASELQAVPSILVFVTAHNAHALEAFRWAACDYLLKPVRRQELEITLRRVDERMAAAAPQLDFEGLLRTLSAVKRREVPDVFSVLVKGRLKVLRWCDVAYLATENRLLFVHVPGGRFVLNRTLDELEAPLAPRFFRCHRSAMVALDQIEEIIPEADGAGTLLTKDGTRLPISRDRMPELRTRLN